MSAHLFSRSFPLLLHRSWSRQIHRATEGAGATQAEPSLPHYFSKQLNTFIETPVVMSVLCVCVPSVPLRVPQPEQPLLPGELGRGNLRCFHEVGTQILVNQYGTRWSFRSYLERHDSVIKLLAGFRNRSCPEPGYSAGAVTLVRLRFWIRLQLKLSLHNSRKLYGT